MNKSFLWQLYITGHTLLFGIPFLFFPNTVLPWLGYESTSGPWVRLAGILFIVIGSTAYTVYRHRIREMLLPSINLRISIVVILLIPGVKSSSLFLYILAAIIFVGVVGSAVCYYTESTDIEYT